MRTLVIDDNKMARHVLKNLVAQVDSLQLAGECTSAVEAVNFLALEKADLLLLDVEMPEMNGEETLKMIRSGERDEIKNIPVIAMTGYTERDLNKSGYSFDGLLIKPVELEDLEKKINEIMDKKQNG